jgi:hypothetical protein
LELNCFNPETKNFLGVDRFTWADRIQLRAFYFNQSNDLVVTKYNRSARTIYEEVNPNLNGVAETFFDDVLANVLGV